MSRSRSDQQTVTRMHHVRSLPRAKKQETKQRRAAAALPDKVVAAAHEAHQAGASLTSIVNAQWEAWGCPTKTEAMRLLRARLRESGLNVRGRGRPETTGISKGRAPTRTKPTLMNERDHAVFERQRQDELAAALYRKRTLRALIAEQKSDDARTQIQSRYVVSLDAARFDEAGAGDVLAEAIAEPDEVEGVGFVYTVQRGGHGSWGAWVERLCERVDAERVLDEIAATCCGSDNDGLRFANRGDRTIPVLLLPERGRWTKDQRRAW